MRSALMIASIGVLLAACGTEPPDDGATPASSSASAAIATDAEPARDPASVAASASTPDEPVPTTAARSAAERDVDARIARILGEPGRYHDAIARLRGAVASDDAAGVAALVRYPLRTELDGRQTTIADAGAFVARYADIMTPDIRRAVLDTRDADLFVNQQGVMLGDGRVWLNGICGDAACTAPDVLVVALQPGAR